MSSPPSSDQGPLLRLAPQAQEVVDQMAADLGSTPVEVVQDAISLFWWLWDERKKGSQLLIQRGEVVTELVPKALRRRW